MLLIFKVSLNVSDEPWTLAVNDGLLCKSLFVFLCSFRAVELQMNFWTSRAWVANLDLLVFL